MNHELERSAGHWNLSELPHRLAQIPGIDGKSIDPSVNPANDFDGFINGRWIDFNPRPEESQGQWGRFEQLSQDINRDLGRILEESAAQVQRGAVSPGEARYLLGQFCLSGLNQELRNAAGAEPLKSEFDAVARISDQKELASTLAQLHRLGIPLLFKFVCGSGLCPSGEC
jgi:putative endopeptidase